MPWAAPRSRFTLLFERLAIDVLRQCDVSGATRILRISWDAAWGLMERAVTRGRHRKTRTVVRRIGVDETATAKGHCYLTLVCDLEEGTVEHIAEDRKQESLEGYYAGLAQEQLDGIEAVAMDMWEPYIQATRARVPDAAEKIVFDRFHVMGHVAKAVDTVRKQEHREGTSGATHSRLTPISDTRRIRTHRQHLDLYQHPVTNAMSEGLNSQIQKIKSMACGFRNTH